MQGMEGHMDSLVSLIVIAAVSYALYKYVPSFKEKVDALIAKVFGKSE